ncbi:MAG: hypothetical protein ACLUQ6_01670 [Alistipes onderdonkii]
MSPLSDRRGCRGRTPSTEVYSTITTDLQNAIALFEQEGYDPKSSTADIDQTVANMVLARVALTTGDYTTAANAAGAVISAGYSLMNEEQYTTSGFQSTSLPETIWGLHVGCFHVARQPFLRIVHVDHGRGQCQQQGYLHGYRRPALQPDRSYRLPQEEFQCDRDHGRGVRPIRPIRTSSSTPRPTRLTKSTCACRRHTC